MKAVEVITSLTIPQYDFRASNGFEVRLMHHEVMTLHQRTMYLTTDYIKKLAAYQHHIINVC